VTRTLATYIRHAERHGVAEVFETAVADLELRELGSLSLRLQHIDGKWTLPQAARRTFALSLYGAGVGAADVCRMAMISRRTLKRALSEVPDIPKCAPEPAFQSGENWTIPATRRNGSRTADLSALLAVDAARARTLGGAA
jgi:hypothetical protein